MPTLRSVVRAGEPPVESFDWGTIQWLDSAALTGHETLTFGLVTILPGCANPLHHHPNCDEVLYVLEGELLHPLGDEEFRLTTGDLIHIPRGVRHQARNVGQTAARVAVSFDSGRRETVGEV